MKNKWMLLMVILGLVLVLTSCGTDQPINAESTGIWNHFFVYPLSWVIIQTAALFKGNFGLAIILVTVVIRFMLLPLVLKQQKSSRAMQAMKPELDELQKKYKTDKPDPKKQQELQKEMMTLYQRNGVNPVAGCLPMFVQMPILMAFYFAIMRTEAISATSFLWFNLGQPDLILPFVAGLTTLIQLRMTSAEMPQQMKVIMYIMPIMIIVAGLSLPSALSMYWVIGNIFTIFQTYFVIVLPRKAAQQQEVSKV
ncbi:membrane protein insertase YidC [Alkalihalobacillus pseudalcaliphilus]|uniref:membrane protein insertase YidC n=1 Tax=Alkalihalobacillus pseudalcaliphilus TaxID=79884 RepID=UPI00064DFAE3|nr:membrane protein insertase YidC [Alkalihalobacillus pseudalcaliphilus]KMK75675.1 OxaA-like protein precursor [Alkalihalobacillus pseudalcaliphilus]